MKNTSFPGMSVKRNFTLIELLVVIAIIAILAAILMPALSSARERGRSASCISNIKQSSAAMALYGDDHEEVYFFGGGRAALDAKDSNDSSRPYYQLAWASKLMAYGYLPYDQWDGVRCPSMKHDDSVFSTLGAVVKNELNLEGGILITNPIPMEYEIPHEQIDSVINQAIDEMNEKNIIGKESTPFLLAKICELTGGNSLESNIKLVYNNCKLAAQIAKGLR